MATEAQQQEEPVEPEAPEQEQDSTPMEGEEEGEKDGVTEEDALDQEGKPPTPPKDDPNHGHVKEDAVSPPSQEPQAANDAAPSIPQSTPTTSAPDTPRESVPYTPRQRTDSQSTTATTATSATRSTAQSTRSSMVFVVAALESIAASKDARKRKALQDSTQRALSAIRTAQGDANQLNPEVLFEPLNLATEAPTAAVVTTALDCIGKLISYSYFSTPPPGSEPQQQRPPLIERAIDTICDCFQGEATPAEVQMQIIKSLLAAILNDKIVVHGAGLLKSVRQTYNIFLLSKSSANQQIAQGTLTQMVNTVFERVKMRLASKAMRMNSSKSSLVGTNGSADPAHNNGETEPPTANSGYDSPTATEPETPAEERGQPKMTLAALESRKSFDDAKITDSAPTTVSRAKRVHPAKQPSRTASGNDIPTITVQGEGSEAPSEDDEEDEIYAKDAYLVFRAMCKLSTKALRPEDAVDNKSQGMRSKLLSLHIIHTLIFNHPTIFTSPHSTIRNASSVPAQFTQAIKQYLLPVLARNASSSAHRVFEVSAEIFALMVRYLRSMLKMEIEVCFREIYFPILEKRVAPGWQKSYIIQHIFERVASDPKALVEIYLNYDCGKGMDNIYQRVIEHTSRAAGQPVSVTGTQQQAYSEKTAAQHAGLNDWREKGTLPPSLATANMGTSAAIEADRIYQDFPPEYALKMQSLECLVETLRSMVNWAEQGVTETTASSLQPEGEARMSVDDLRESTDTRGEPNGTPSLDGGPVPDAPPMAAVAEDDPAELERVKQNKTALNNAIKQFNYKPKKGIKLLISDGFIPSTDPTDIARFMLNNDRINKKSLGEFLGEGDEENIKIMHAFVDLMDFNRTRFVDALRRFLQSFRLPGEAQKIDRLMLKFAERYLAGNPAAFANADTAYVLSYSVIMLNTDQHSAQVKVRMTPEDFIKNNRGINDSADLPDDYLRGIYEEITHNEIVLDTERETAANLGFAAQQPPAGGLVSALANVGRDLQREAYAQASDEMSSRTELLFKNLLRAQKRNASSKGGDAAGGKGRYLTASSFKHVGPMFEQTWMSFLTALSGSAQETQNLETVRLAMEGQQKAIRIACLFDLEDPRQAFVQSMAKATKLDNISEMKVKNVEALKVLLSIAWTEGNLLKESWTHILTCISQLDRLQLISSGVEENAVPDMLRSSTPVGSTTNPHRKSMQVPRGRPASRATPSTGVTQPEIAAEAQNASMVRVVDRIFTHTATLSGPAIVHFVRALTQVSWQEIQSSGSSESPRTYSLQKLVEISGYNMRRVRFEWTKIWEVLGAHFVEVGCHSNTHVVYFALDSLRQLSMRFMELEELPGFKFQKDFLKPFEVILGSSRLVGVKDMVLRCLMQMIQARGEMIRSGWRTMFGVFTVAAREENEGVVGLAFENVTQVYQERFGSVISQGAFADLVVCLTEFSKNRRFQKKSLQAIETLRSSVPKMLRTPECPLSRHAVGSEVEGGMEKAQAEGSLARQPTRQSQEEQYWFPVLFAFHDVLMTGEDLEVRSRALNYLFDTLTRYGGDFPRDFWDTLWRQLLFPIFVVLKDRKAINQEAANHEELSENDTLARIGSNCLQQLILQNVKKFSPEHWDRIVGAFVDLFARTEARELFTAATGGYGQRRESEMMNGLLGGSGAMTPDDASSITLGSNALRINGLPAETPTSSEVPTVNGDSRPATLRTETSTTHSLSLSDDPDLSGRDISPTPSKRSDLEDFAPPSATAKTSTPIPVTAARRRYFNQIITKCVLQLLMIETVSELFNNDAVYASIPSHLLLRLMALLKKSYHFAKRFNEDRELRTRLFREGFMKQPPNLLKQESGSASVYVGILLRMYKDDTDERVASRADTEAALIPLCSDIVASYIALDEETQQRNIVTWRPVVVDVLEGYVGFADREFGRQVEVFAPLAVGLMGREMGAELQRAVQGVWGRVCEVKLGIEGVREMGPMSPRAGGFEKGRRGSKGRG
ncbi:guanine nucleotide exchange protein for ADP-robosylation factor [Rachicladosporium monterosium]|uniref:Guanine nucleotide exchange protein for ADP-robosylation factor n=1 Tax=Rachicladosporium monterosium TaxID=1507873 RepID=A0ABR0L4J5_9PEZI|nr:guanine nucleotide exchange protein for ADP-robosylation factor [Rachicladosporium monterosium]